MEEWKPVLGYESVYEVSNFGRVRRVARGKLFTAEQVRQAKQMLAQGAKLREVAAFMGTSNATASAIKNGKTWVGDEFVRPCKVSLDSHQYPSIALCRNGVYTRKRVHRIMWEAFNGPIEGRLEVNHKNLKRDDNRLENLELLTHRENIQHAFDLYRQDPSSRQPAGKPGSYRGKYFKHT